MSPEIRLWKNKISGPADVSLPSRQEVRPDADRTRPLSASTSRTPINKLGARRLTHTEARSGMLAAQGLHRRPRKKATKPDVLRAVRRMGALQIDTIHVVARSPYLVLWSRLGEYDPRWLEELLAEGKLFEYWSHEACFLPAEDYPLYRHRMLEELAL